jgi:hypothetical protein
MEILFGPDKQYFTAWIDLYDIDVPTFDPFTFRHMLNYPQRYVDSSHFQLAQLLHRNGSSVDPRGFGTFSTAFRYLLRRPRDDTSIARV